MNVILAIVLAFAAVTIAWFWFERSWDRRLFAREDGKVCANVRARAAHELLRIHNDLQVLDVRSRAEFAAGALPKALHISVGDPAFAEKISKLERSKPMLVYCAGGFRSRKAVRVLREHGFESIYHLHRGFHSWKLAGLPISRKERN